MEMNSLKWKVQCSQVFISLGYILASVTSVQPQGSFVVQNSSKSWKGITMVVRPWQRSRSQSTIFLQKAYRQNCAPETSGCHPPLLRLSEVLFPGKLLLLKSAFESALKCISTRTSFELRKQKCYFLTFHWWSIDIQTLERQAQHRLVPVMSIPCCLCSACPLQRKRSWQELVRHKNRSNVQKVRPSPS